MKVENVLVGAGVWTGEGLRRRVGVEGVQWRRHGERHVALVEGELLWAFGLKSEDRDFGAASERGANLAAEDEEQGDASDIELEAARAAKKKEDKSARRASKAEVISSPQQRERRKQSGIPLQHVEKEGFERPEYRRWL